jgi:predicted NBD/HSP70 family sugar kinase
MNDVRVLPGGDQSALRHLNTSRILRILYDGGPLTVNALARVTGLSRPTVRGIVTALLDTGLLAPAGQAAARTGGRPAQRYAFDRSAGVLAGVRFDTEGVWVRLTDLSGEPVARGHRHLPADAGPAERLDAAAAVVGERVAERKVPLWALTAGTPGIIDASGVVRVSAAIPGWAGVRLGQELSTRLGCPVTTVKDTNLAALAEHRIGAARGTSDLLYVQMDRRLGVGVLVGGLPFTGQSGAAGEIGRHPGLGWEEAPARLAAASGSRHDPHDEAGALTLTRALHGDPDAQAAASTYARTLADGIGAMVLAVDPRLIVLGGSLAAQGTALLEPIERRLEEICYEVPPVALTALTEDAVTAGAVEAARDLVRERMPAMMEQLMSD